MRRAGPTVVSAAPSQMTVAIVRQGKAVGHSECCFRPAGVTHSAMPSVDLELARARRGENLRLAWVAAATCRHPERALAREAGRSVRESSTQVWCARLGGVEVNTVLYGFFLRTAASAAGLSSARHQASEFIRWA